MPDAIGFICWLFCFTPLVLIGVMLISIFGVLVLNMIFGKKT